MDYVRRRSSMSRWFTARNSRVLPSHGDKLRIINWSLGIGFLEYTRGTHFRLKRLIPLNSIETHSVFLFGTLHLSHECQTRVLVAKSRIIAIECEWIFRDVSIWLFAIRPSQFNRKCSLQNICDTIQTVHQILSFPQIDGTMQSAQPGIHGVMNGLTIVKL